MVVVRKWQCLIPLHGRGSEAQAPAARFNSRGHGSEVSPGSTFATPTQIVSGLLSKWATSRTLMCISKTKAGREGRALISHRFMAVMKSGLNKVGSARFLHHLATSKGSRLLFPDTPDEKATNLKENEERRDGGHRLKSLKSPIQRAISWPGPIVSSPSRLLLGPAGGIPKTLWK